MHEGTKFKHRLRWNWANMGRMFLQRFDPPLDADLRPLSETLMREGIVTCDVRQLLGADAPLFDRVREKTLALYQSDAIRDKAAKMDGEKKFKVFLLDRAIAYDDPVMQLSLHPRVLALVNRYMGMRSYLRALDLWWDRPTPDGPAATQLWHRDLDDPRCIKAFIYFNDVDMQTGPFSYLRGTHMFGRHANLQPGGSSKNRFSDEEIVAPLSMADAQINTGPAGTMILCDTYGFHRGLKPEKDRLMSLFQYVSRASKYPREFRVQGEAPALQTAQQQALDPLPADAVRN
ncbi:MAG TPA: hypothetical protein VHY09_07620 [Candidatus Methylacidiphilales bacterium]|nr:hypothetical protein [Candidatus Methylacidiphilales bacterium]